VTVVGGAASIPDGALASARSDPGPRAGVSDSLAAAAGGPALGRLPAGQDTVCATCGGGTSPLRQSMPSAGVHADAGSLTEVPPCPPKRALPLSAVCALCC
jgi:hypothetical protein